MKSSRRALVTLPLVTGLLAVLSFSSLAGSNSNVPAISQGKGDKCVEDTAFMRRNHMELLKHHRDETMHEGIRTKKYDINECINCHVQADAQGVVPTIDSPKHFCVSCHRTAAVTIDCFECHADRPKTDNQTAYQHKLAPNMPHHGMGEMADSGKVANDALNLINGEAK